MDDTAATLRDLLQQSRPRTASLGWPREIRIRVGRHARTRRSRGEGWTVIGNSLGISRNTVRVWVKAQGLAANSSAMVPVVVVEDPHTIPTSTPVVSELVLISPSGFRLEGLSISAAITALEQLR